MLSFHYFYSSYNLEDCFNSTNSVFTWAQILADVSISAQMQWALWGIKIPHPVFIPITSLSRPYLMCASFPENDKFKQRNMHFYCATRSSQSKVLFVCCEVTQNDPWPFSHSCSFGAKTCWATVFSRDFISQLATSNNVQIYSNHLANFIYHNRCNVLIWQKSACEKLRSEWWTRKKVIDAKPYGEQVSSFFLRCFLKV